MMRIYIILIFLILPGTIFSQESNSVEAKNLMSLDAASILYTGNCAVNYEHQIYSTKSYRSMINVGFGPWYSFNNYGSVNLDHVASSYSVPVTLNTFLGTRKWRFECDFGVRFLIPRRWDTFQDNGVVQSDPRFDNSIARPVFNVGYRFQKPNGKFVFRAFIGLGGIGMGIGRAF